MYKPDVYLDDAAFLWGESDRLNFICWYMCLRWMLVVNGVLYVLEEQPGDRPENTASEN
jgi:hypothetical protein